MTPLKEMYERLAELQAKEKRFSEEETELSELNNLIATREKYLQRYINHPPRMVDRVSTIIMDLDEVTPGKEIIGLIEPAGSMVHDGSYVNWPNTEVTFYHLTELGKSYL